MTDTNTGYRNTGSWNTGSWNTGYRNTGDRNTGDWNTGHRNTGHRNTGSWNTGDRNTGDWNTGYTNTGYRNTGSWNTGSWNTGYRNTGDRNTGDWNTGDWNTGYFNTTTPDKVRVFDGPEVNRDEFISACPSWLYLPSPTTWVADMDMTDVEKLDNPTFHTCGGYLRVNDWHSEWRKAYEGASPEDVQKVRDLPGFDVKVFEAITGLDLTVAECPCKPTEVIIDGVRYIRADI